MRKRLNKNRKKFPIFFIVSIFLFAICIYLFLKLNLFKIKTLDITGQNLNCVNSDQIKEMSDLYGKNFFSVDTSMFNKKVKEKFLCVKELNFSKKIPDTLKVDVIGRKPIAQIRRIDGMEASISAIFEIIATSSATESADSYLLDEEGIIFAKTNDSINIPNIFVSNINLSLGSKLGNNTEGLLKVLEKVKVFGIDTSKLMISNNYLYIFSSPKVIFDLTVDLEFQIASLQLILEKSKIDESMVEFIDLRFDKPIIKIAPKKNG